MHYWVYVHTCKANGKRYVGVTTASKPEIRWKGGRGYCQNKHFYSAIQKYGWANFQHEAWELTCESEMYYAEKYLIAYYHTTESKFGYNHSSGGEKGALGCTRSEETRRKISEAHKGKPGKPHSEEAKRRISEANRGQIRSEESRKRIAENNRRKAKDPEFRRKISEAKKGKPRRPCSEEARKHIAEASKKVHADPEYRKKLSEALKGKTRSEETKRRMSEAKKGKPQLKIKIKLPDETVLEIPKSLLTRWYINKGKKFEYVD